MNIPNSDYYVRKTLVDALEKIEAPLTSEQAKQYAMIMNTDVAEEKIDAILHDMSRDRTIYIKEDMVYYILPRRGQEQKIDVRKNIAFSVFLRFAKLAGEKFASSNFPSQIVFLTDEVYRITVCSDPKDKHLRMLKEGKLKDDVIDIIVGYNLAANEIDKSFLPDKEFIFAHYKANDALSGNPQIDFERVRLNV